MSGLNPRFTYYVVRLIDGTFVCLNYYFGNKYLLKHYFLITRPHHECVLKCIDLPGPPGPFIGLFN